MRSTPFLGRGVGGAPVQSLPRPKATLRLRAAQQEVEVERKGKASEQDKQAAQQSGEEVYIGFDKSDIGSRAGRKGRVVTDDPKRYPDRTTFTGGWAGGEVGLQQFVKGLHICKKDSIREETGLLAKACHSSRAFLSKNGGQRRKTHVQEEEAAKAQNVQKAKVVDRKKSEAKAVTADGEEIYLGFGKDELVQRKAGGQGRFIRDDPKKYPNKEDLGLLSGITGGFAGGEKGVQQFAATGELKFSEQGTKEFSPVVIAAVVAGGVTTGAVLLNSGVLLTEEAITSTLQNGGSALTQGTTELAEGITIDANTKLLLNVAFALLGLGSVVIGARAVTKRLQESSVQLKEDAVNVGKIVVFWILVLLVALYVIDSQ